MAKRINQREARRAAEQTKDEVIRKQYGKGVELWWKTPRDKPQQVSAAVSATVRNVRNQQKWRDISIVQWGSMYQGPSFLQGNATAPPSVIAAASGPGTAIQRPPKYNLTYSITQTLKNRIIKSDPTTSFMTDDGDYNLQRKAKMLNGFAEGLFYQQDGYRIMADGFEEVGIYGTGITKQYVDEDDNIQLDLIYPGCLWVDAVDGMRRQPRSFYEINIIDRDVLAARFPERADDIYDATPYNPSKSSDLYYYSNLIWCFEAIHLGVGTNPGRRVLVIQGLDPLVDEDYAYPTSPYRIMRFSRNSIGMWGMGIAELISGHQKQIDRSMEVEAQSHNLVSVPRVWVDIDSGVNTMALETNRAGTMGFYRGTPPVFMAAEAVNPGFSKYIEDKINEAYNFIGVSRLSASSQKPAGLDSGEAIRTAADVESDRFSQLSKDFDAWKVEIDLKNVELAAATYGKGSYKVKTVGKKYLQTYDWKDLADIRQDEYKLKAWPSALLPKTPQGQLAQAQELVQAQFISIDEARQMVSLPDMPSVLSLYDSVLEYAMRVVDDMLHEGKFMPPDPMITDTTMVKKIVAGSYLKALNQKVPEDRLQLLRNFQSLLVANDAAAQQPPPGPPMAKGAPPPVSNLRPFGAAAGPPPGAPPSA